MSAPPASLATGSGACFGRQSSETHTRHGHAVHASPGGTSGRDTDQASAPGEVALRDDVQHDVGHDDAGVAVRGVREALTVDQARRRFDVGVLGTLHDNRAVLACYAADPRPEDPDRLAEYDERASIPVQMPASIGEVFSGELSRESQAYPWTSRPNGLDGGGEVS